MYVDILILAHLLQRPYHGYELKRQVESVGSTINNNQLYPALKRFEEMGAITRKVEHQAGKPDRHIYHITNRGEEVLQAMLQEFPPELAADDGEFLTRVAFFHLLDTDARLAILTTRQAARQQDLRQMQQFEELLEREGSDAQNHYSLGVLRFRQHQFQLELDWIAHLIEEEQQ